MERYALRNATHGGHVNIRIAIIFPCKGDRLSIREKKQGRPQFLAPRSNVWPFHPDVQSTIDRLRRKKRSAFCSSRGCGADVSSRSLQMLPAQSGRKGTKEEFSVASTPIFGDQAVVPRNARKAHNAAVYLPSVEGRTAAARSIVQSPLSEVRSTRPVSVRSAEGLAALLGGELLHDRQ
jgi:hypothetical protein